MLQYDTTNTTVLLFSGHKLKMGGQGSTPVVASQEDVDRLSEKVDELDRKLTNQTNEIRGNFETIRSSLTDIQKGMRDTERIHAARDAVISAIGLLEALAADPPNVSEIGKGVLGMAAGIAVAAIAPPVGELVAAFASVFSSLLLGPKTKSTAEILHDELVKYRAEEDQRDFQGLQDQLIDFVNASVPTMTSDIKETPVQYDFLREFVNLAGKITSRFSPSKAKSDDLTVQRDVAQSVTLYCMVNIQYIHALTSVLAKCVSLKRDTDVKHIQGLQNDLTEEIAPGHLQFWIRFWKDYQNKPSSDDTRKKFFKSVSVDPFPPCKPYVYFLEPSNEAGSRMKLVVKNVEEAGPRGELPVGVPMPVILRSVYESEYDFTQLDWKNDMPVLACVYFRQLQQARDKQTATDPTYLRMFCQGMLGIKSMSVDEVSDDDKQVFEIILSEELNFFHSDGGCIIL